MTTRKQETAEVLFRLYRLGFTATEAQALRGIAMTLSRWDEVECNGDIERDEATGKPFRCWDQYTRQQVTIRRRSPVADREAGALRRLARILEAHPDLAAYHQSDPRGASLYIYPKAKMEPGQDIACWYSSIGTAVY
jgi:hypothetical protein